MDLTICCYLLIRYGVLLLVQNMYQRLGVIKITATQTLV